MATTNTGIHATLKKGGLEQTKETSAIKPTIFRILIAISLVHLINDTIQSIIPAILPILKTTMNLTYLQAGIIVFSLNITSSVLQPVVGLYADKRPSPYMLPLGVLFTFFGVLGVAISPNYVWILISALFVGLGSAIFHPEASRVAYMAAGSRRGLAQSIFQVGGNSGHSLASIMTALIFVPLGQFGAIWFTLITLLGIGIQIYIARWYKSVLKLRPPVSKGTVHRKINSEKRNRIISAIIVIILIIFARSWYNAGISIYFPFHLMDKFGVSLEHAQIYIFLFAAAGVLGTFLGGPLSDKFGRRNVILYSMVGSSPIALLLPYANPTWTYALLLLNGLIFFLSFSVTVVYAQELVPGKIGTVSGLTTGMAFGMGALGAVGLGGLADSLSLKYVLDLVSYLPMLGTLGFLLPGDKLLRAWSEKTDRE